MTPIPLSKLHLPPKHRLSALLWWLGLLYRRPQQFSAALEGLSQWKKLARVLRLSAHSLPYQVFLGIVGRLVLFGQLDVPTAELMNVEDHLAAIGGGIAGGVSIGLVGGITWGTAAGIAHGLSFAIAFGIFGGISVGIVGGVAFGAALGIALGVAVGAPVRPHIGLVFVILVGIPTGIAGMIADWAVKGGIFGIAAGIAYGIAATRTFYLPIHLFLVWAQPRPSLYRYHPVAWDDLCGARFPGLHRLLVVYASKNPHRGTAEIERLIDTYPTQRYEAQKAKAILLARKSQEVRNLTQLPEICSHLPEGSKGFLSETPRLKAKIDDLVALQRQLHAMDRPFLQEPTAQNLVDRIATFHDQISMYKEPLASEFGPASRSWLKVATEQRDHARKILEREPTAQVFRAGDPVDRDREAFVPRFPIFETLEGQVMLVTGCPGILLYGRRRMGKSTVLKNLPGFLPSGVRLVSVSMQNPRASSSHAQFSGYIGEAILTAVHCHNEPECPKDLPGLYRFLDGVESHFQETGERLLLGVDEYENIDRKLREGVFTEDLLDTVRESIQSHRQITWVFSGSHSIDELDGAEWASYLVSARTVEVPPFSHEETRLLLTEPLKHSRLWDKDDPARPRFSPGMWGEGGIERIQAETGGWPHLVQLVAETLVDRMNDAGKGRVDEDLFERSLDAAVVAGDTVLSQLLRGESRVPGEWEYLLGFRERAAQAPPEDDEVRRSLRRRLLVVEDREGGEWRLRAPLFARWLRNRG